MNSYAASTEIYQRTAGWHHAELLLEGVLLTGALMGAAVVAWALPKIVSEIREETRPR
jgi:hypothetical protein